MHPVLLELSSGNALNLSSTRFKKKREFRTKCAVLRRRLGRITSIHAQFSVTRTQCADPDRIGAIVDDSDGDDERVLELELQRAIRDEDYSKAALLRDRLRVLQQNGVAAVLEVNSRFYKAFEQGDLAAMRKLWAKGENVHCIHPRAGRISGHEMVIASWEVMLGPEVDLPLKIKLEDVEVSVKGGMGYVTCFEVVRSGSSWGRQSVTNVFEKHDGVWHICMHHASPVPDPFA